MSALARVLMGLSHPVQLIAQTREHERYADWPRPPRLTRRWLAVIDDDATGWRSRTLHSALAGVGLRTEHAADDYLREPAVQIETGCVNDGRDYCASLVLRRWPREVAPGWLGNALAGDIPADVAIHVQPQDAAWVARKLKLQQSRHQDSDDAGDMLSTRDARRVREDLIARKDRPVKVAVVLTVRAPRRELLKPRVETLAHEIGLALGDVRAVTFEHDRGLDATLPTGRCDLLGAWHTLDCMSVASTWPFQPVTVDHANGAAIGTTGGMLVKLDPFDPSLESFGILVIGKTGVGKSYLLKLIIRRLHGVEVLVVDQRNPSEYVDTPGVQITSLAGLSKRERVNALREFIVALWAEAKRRPRPRLLILDELYALLKDQDLADLIEEIAREGRRYFLSLLIATQQVRELLERGEAVLDNSAIKIYLKQHDNDLDKLCDAVGLSAPARRFLRGAARGQALLDVSGMLVPVDIQASPADHAEITTDPRERYVHVTEDVLVSDHGMGALADTSGDAPALQPNAETGLLAVPGVAAAHSGFTPGE